MKCVDEKYFTYKLKIISQDHHRIGSGTASPMSPGNEETEHRSTSVSAFSIQTENTEENCKFCSHMYFFDLNIFLDHMSECDDED